MRLAAACLAILPIVAACAPMIEVRDRSRNDALVFSTYEDATPVRTPCPPGFSPVFPDEDYYTLPDGKRTVPLTVRVADRNGIRRAAVVFPVGEGRPADYPDAPELRYDMGRFDVLARVIEFNAARGGAPTALQFRFIFETNLSSGTGFYVVALDDAGPFPLIPFVRRDYVSVRQFSTVCAA